MRLSGNLDLQNNLLLNPAIGQQESFPENPRVGSMIFKGQRVMICIDIAENLPVWAPLTAPLNTHIHEQAASAKVWTIEHNLNASACICQVVASDGRHILPDEVEYEHNKVTVRLLEAQSGRAVLMLGNPDGAPRAEAKFEQSFEAESTWVVTHMLGYEPLVRTFIGNQEVQPRSITHIDANTAEVTFTSPRSGYVRCI